MPAPASPDIWPQIGRWELNEILTSSLNVLFCISLHVLFFKSFILYLYVYFIYIYCGENLVMNHVWKIMKRQGKKTKCWWVAKYIGINECRNLSQLSHLWFRSRINPGISISTKSIFFQGWIGFTRSKPYIWRLPLHIW